MSAGAVSRHASIQLPTSTDLRQARRLQHTLLQPAVTQPRRAARSTSRPLLTTCNLSSPQAPASPQRPRAATRLHAVAEAEHKPESPSNQRWPDGFREQYRLGEFLGRGSFGTVNACMQLATGRQFAVKCIPKEAQSPVAQQRAANIHAEVEILERLQDCRNVIGLQDVFEDTDHVYMVTEACFGGDLDKFLQKHQHMPEHQTAKVVHDILKVLVDCHKQSIVYADIKPANFLLQQPYASPDQPVELRVVDFGCSRNLQQGEKLGKRTGTPLYMAPELFMRYFGVEADLWGLGMLMHQLLVGKLPWFDRLRERSPFHVMSAILNAELDLSADPAWEHISPEAKDLVSRLLDRDYGSRLTAQQALTHPWVQRHCSDIEGCSVVAEAPLLPDN